MTLGESVRTVTAMPTARQPGWPFDPLAELIQAREHGPISGLTFADGPKSG